MWVETCGKMSQVAVCVWKSAGKYFMYISRGAWLRPNHSSFSSSTSRSNDADDGDVGEGQQASSHTSLNIFKLTVPYLRNISWSLTCLSTKHHWCKTLSLPSSCWCPALTWHWTHCTCWAQQLSPGCCSGDMSLQRTTVTLPSSLVSFPR